MIDLRSPCALDARRHAGESVVQHRKLGIEPTSHSLTRSLKQTRPSLAVSRTRKPARCIQGSLREPADTALTHKTRGETGDCFVGLTPAAHNVLGGTTQNRAGPSLQQRERNDVFEKGASAEYLA